MLISVFIPQSNKYKKKKSQLPLRNVNRNAIILPFFVFLGAHKLRKKEEAQGIYNLM